MCTNILQQNWFYFAIATVTIDSIFSVEYTIYAVTEQVCFFGWGNVICVLCNEDLSHWTDAV